MSILSIDQLHAGYNGVPVVRDLTLHVDEGEVVALLGANGAGKTTTLLTASGILPAIKGDIHLDGKSIKGVRPHRLALRGVAHVPEDRALFLSLTVTEHLKLAAHRFPDAQESAYQTFPELRTLGDRRASLLSGGEQQMLALARAAVCKPRILMIDEMSLGLAPIIVKRFLDVVREIANSTRCGVLIVEQHVHLALEVADRAYVLSHGDLVMERQANDLVDDAHLLAASYLGDEALARSGD